MTGTFILRAVAVLISDSGHRAIVRFEQTKNNASKTDPDNLEVAVNLRIPKVMCHELKEKNTNTQLRGFHIHNFGDTTQGCISAGPHFNPFNVKHGSLTSSIRHLGDLGNIDLSEWNQSNDFEYTFKAKGISLDHADGFSRCILGRSVVLHADEDDLGLTDHELSPLTGNAGGRFSCGVIGYSEKN